MKLPFLLSISIPFLLSSPALAQGHWPEWRGPQGTGEALASANPPIEWGNEQNIRWKVEIPGRGKGTPLIFDDLVFVLTAEGFGDEVEIEEPEAEEGRGGGRGGRMPSIQPTQKQRSMVLALRRKDGSVAWKAVANESLPHEGTHGDGSWSSSSAVTDGKRLFADFGSRGLYAYDMQGKLLWEKQLGQMNTRRGFGEGSTPALHGDTIVSVRDQEGPSVIVALDANTGAEKWRKDRDEDTSWATPMIVEVDGKAQVITCGTKRVRSYDLETGDLVWECRGLTANAIPSPVHRDGTAYLTSGFRGSALLAIKLSGAKGDLDETDAILWQAEQDTPYVPSPLLLGDRLYFVKSDSGILSSYDAKTGKAVFGPERMQTVANVYASPVAAAGRVYLVGRDGETEVLEHGTEYKVLATNVLDDAFDSSPAIAENEIYLRGKKFLYCIAGEEKRAAAR